jgi:hypothetical protein
MTSFYENALRVIVDKECASIENKPSSRTTFVLPAANGQLSNSSL